MTGIVIDCVKSPSAAAMRAAGVTGVNRYLSTVGSDPLDKIIHKPEYDSLIAAGFDVLLNWEHSAQDWLGGASAGASHASQAVAQARALGYPAGCAIVGSADFDMTSSQWNSAGKAYAQAFSAGIRAGGYVAGVYGPWDVLTWCRDLGGFAVYWQAGMSTAWSGGRNKNAWPGAHLRQRRGATIGGVSVDENDIIQARYGQAPLGDGMEQTDKLAYATDLPARTVGQVFADLENLRNYLFAAPGAAKLVNPPAAGSLLDLLAKLATNVDVKALAQEVVTLLPPPPTAADIAAALIAALQKG